LFNPVSFYILLTAIILGSLYSSILRDKVGYLSLPPIEGLIFLCGWACFSPQTVFTSVLPWYLYLLGLVWQSGHIMAHYVLHIRYDDDKKPVIWTPALFSKPSPRSASIMVMSFAILLFLMSVVMPVLTSLSYLYLVPVIGWGVYTLFRCRSFLRNAADKESLHKAWSSLSMLRMVISLAILLSVLVYP
jgi:heme O synthase-like polyprenyltransferase